MRMEEVIRLLAERTGKVDIKPSDRLREDLGLDSLDAVELEMTIEERFGIRVEWRRFFTVSDLLNYIKEVIEDGDTT